MFAYKIIKDEKFRYFILKQKEDVFQFLLKIAFFIPGRPILF
ncbi:hypothetical protein BSM4216_0911 [Bacillus smithii]|nr:hypothetical protein BSM4216_0911 [Bacillus smithii]